MAKQSAGLLVYRRNNGVEVLLVHPGGPFWAKKDAHAWSIPKGEFKTGEEAEKAAKREFEEEIGQPAPEGEYVDLGSTKQKGGKEVFAWAVERDLDTTNITSNTFTMEWPPRSGNQQEFPEVDRAQWFDLETASSKVHPGQSELLARLAEKLGVAYTDKSNELSDGELNSQQISLL
jgi:predicted NUDIX family NTP pyrophosphohydrolase